MLLCIDIGNTNIKYGVFDNNKLVASFRVASKLSRTADEYGSVLVNLLGNDKIDISHIDGIMISSVIPSLNYTICHMCEYFFGIEPTMVESGIKTGLNIKVDNPKEVGADIIVNSVAAFNKYGGPLVVVDFGTATTFDVISEKCELLGVIIAPGIKTSLEGLVSNTAQLPMIELNAPKSAIGKSTKTSMQAGVVFGFAGLVENILNKIKKELALQNIKIVATGGLGEIVTNEVESEIIVDRTLTLEGLQIIYNLNRSKVS